MMLPRNGIVNYGPILHYQWPVQVASLGLLSTRTVPKPLAELGPVGGRGRPH